ncbi:lysozyme inhibitor LprI family protein [Oceanicaulis sp.]|uniref:lysozyme inhibitor LprI family protein n=1 Tax=Oceanicaulis sp. TaxID=1924941 RepID=UPI003BA93A71
MLPEILAVALALNAQEASTAVTEAAQTDAARLNACLAQAEFSEACIGAVSSACQDDPGGYTTYGMMECERRENALWDQRLNAAYSQMRERMLEREATTRRDALLAAQRLWLQYRDAECEQRGLAYEGGTMRGVVHSSCFSDFTARRALELERQLDELSR